MCMDAPGEQLCVASHSVAKADEGDSCTVKLTGRAAGVIRSDVHDGDILGRGPCSRAEPARLSERKLLARVQHDSLKEIAVPSEPHKAKEGYCATAMETASSKDDTTVVEVPAGSPRDSKSNGTVCQRKASPGGCFLGKGTDSEELSVSSVSELGKAGVPSLAGPSTPRGTGGSDVSNHSRLRTAVDDSHEADSHSTPRATDAKPRLASPAARSGSCHSQAREEEGQEEIGSRSPSAHDKAAQDSADQQAAGNKRPRSQGPEGEPAAEESREAALRMKVEAQPAADSPAREISPKQSLNSDASAASKVLLEEKVVEVRARATGASVSPAGRSTPLPSRGAPVAPGAYRDDDEEDDGAPIPRKIQRKPRSKPSRKGPPTPGQRRSSRVAALDFSLEGGADADEDYLPPGEFGDALPSSGSKRTRATRSQSGSLSRAPTSLSTVNGVSPASGQRSTNRLRWSASSSGGLASPTARRLRSQPLDISCLVPDAYACFPPPKRVKQSALTSGLADLRQLEASLPTPLARSAKGSAKPYPAWRQEPEALVEAAQRDQLAAADRHSADMKLLDGQPVRPPRWDDLTARLGCSPLAKALKVSTQIQEAEPLPTPDEGAVLGLCRKLMPKCLASAAEAWEERLSAPCTGVLGEPTTCIKARRERDLQNIWDDLLARHALEQAVLESCAQAFAVPVDKGG